MQHSIEALERYRPEEIFEYAGQLRARMMVRERTDVLENPKASRDMFRDFLGGRDNEAFAVAFLDTQHKLIKLEILFNGTIDGASVYPRVVVKRALDLNAAALILSHNHPSGVAEPSLADQAITRRLKDACALLDIRLLDHIVVAGEKTVSMAERGMV